MAEFRYSGLTAQNKRIIGFVEARNRRFARQKIDILAKQHRFTVSSILKKSTYLYQVRRPNGSTIKGQQEAFSKDEVEQALHRMGFYDVKVEKMLFNLQFKPPYSDIVTFIRLTADLLREKLPFDEILSLLETDISNKSMKKVIKEILGDLKEGKDGEEVFQKQAYYLGKFPAKMLGVASKSGNMAEVYENTAVFLERVHDFRKNLRSALLMPSITMLVLAGAVVFYVGYIFPKTAELFTRFGAELPPLTDATLKLSYFFKDNIIMLVITTIIPPVLFIQCAMSSKGKEMVSRYAIKLPIIGPILHKTSIEIFCRVFYSMYSGSGNNIEVIRTAAEACRNAYMEKQIKNVTLPLMIREGMSFVEALKQAKIFTRNALTRFNTGAESGTLKRVSIQIARYYERDTTYKMKAIIDWIQVFVAFLIMIIMTLITVVSSETALFQPKLPGM